MSSLAVLVEIFAFIIGFSLGMWYAALVEKGGIPLLSGLVCRVFGHELSPVTDWRESSEPDIFRRSFLCSRCYQRTTIKARVAPESE